jgi:hypothetical protein
MHRVSFSGFAIASPLIVDCESIAWNKMQVKQYRNPYSSWNRIIVKV